MEKVMEMKGTISVCLGLVGGMIVGALGGLDKILLGFLIIMIVDYISGLIVAIVFKNSPKTETGAAQSKAGFIGLVKKSFILMIIVVVNQIDIVLGAGGFIRSSAIIGFMVNECLSIVENAGLMGIKLPPALIEAIDILKKKSESKDSKGA